MKVEIASRGEEGEKDRNLRGKPDQKKGKKRGLRREAVRPQSIRFELPREESFRYCWKK